MGRGGMRHFAGRLLRWPRGHPLGLRLHTDNICNAATIINFHTSWLPRMAGLTRGRVDLSAQPEAVGHAGGWACLVTWT